MDEPIVIPLRQPHELARVGRVAGLFATVFHRSIEVVTIIDPQDDLAIESARLDEAADALRLATGHVVDVVTLVDSQVLSRFIDHCRDRLVCMATGASPFDEDHYVGSFAAALLAETTSPVILVGPRVAELVDTSIDRVVLAISSDVDGSASLAVAHEFAVALGCSMAKIRVDETHGIIYESSSHDPQEWFPEEVHASMRSEPIATADVCDVLVDRSHDGLLVLATRANRGLAWICEGSVAFSAIAQTTMPIVAVGPHASSSVPWHPRGR